MGARGAYGFRIWDRDKVTYCHDNAGPMGLGTNLAKWCAAKPLDALKKIAAGVQLVDEHSTPSVINKIAYNQYADTSVGNQSLNSWYCLLRNAQGNFEALDNGLSAMIDSHVFLTESLHCEWAYIFDIDHDVLEIYQGYQNKEGTGRYDSQISPAKNGHFGVALLDSIHGEILRKLTSDEISAYMKAIDSLGYPMYRIRDDDTTRRLSASAKSSIAILKGRAGRGDGLSMLAG